MSVFNLSIQDLQNAVRQLVATPGFRPANTHLTATEINSIGAGVWPVDKPVFTPYACTHHGYSQSKTSLEYLSPYANTLVRYNGVKYLLHRVTYQSAHQDLHQNMDISHILYLGRNTARYIHYQTEQRTLMPAM
jgi:hypothetical protein